MVADISDPEFLKVIIQAVQDKKQEEEKAEADVEGAGSEEAAE